MHLGSRPHRAKNIIVTLDFDGTIAYGVRAKKAAAKDLYGISCDDSQLTKATFPHGAEKYAAMMRIVTTDMIMEYDLAPHCRQVLDRLYHEGFRFAVVTSRSTDELHACKRFVRHHRLPVSYFHNTDDNPKDYVCRRLRARALIDDTLKKLMPLKGTPLELFFLRQEWNRHEHLPMLCPSNLHEIGSWREFYSGLHQLRILHEAVCYSNGWENSWKDLDRIVSFIRDHPGEAKKQLRQYKDAA